MISGPAPRRRRGRPRAVLRPRPVRDGRAELEPLLGQAAPERLGVGVRHDELHALQVRLDHVIDGIAARAANTEHDDVRL